jgi:hypothetical protein
MQASAADIFDKYADNIAVVLSELSADGNDKYMRGYVENHGIPVMTFPWAVDPHVMKPVDTPNERDVVFIGTYWEKTTRLDDWVLPSIEDARHLVVGPAWVSSAVPGHLMKRGARGTLDMREEYDRGKPPVAGVWDATFVGYDSVAPRLYSSSTVALNVHHDFEAAEGFSCNERTFVAAACGAMVVNDDNPRVRELIPEAWASTDPADMRIRVGSLVFSESVGGRPAKQVAREAKKVRERIRDEHTYEHRMAALLNFVYGGDTSDQHCTVMAD